MARYSEELPIIGTFDTVSLILLNFLSMPQKWLRMAYDANEWQTLHNMASVGPVYRIAISGDQLWSKISNIKLLVHSESELRYIG